MNKVSDGFFAIFWVFLLTGTVVFTINQIFTLLQHLGV